MRSVCHWGGVGSLPVISEPVLVSLFLTIACVQGLGCNVGVPGVHGCGLEQRCWFIRFGAESYFREDF